MRTDLAVEIRESLGKDKQIDGIYSMSEKKDGININRIKITTIEASKKMNKPQGNYITVDVPSFTDDARDNEEKIEVIADEIRALLPKKGLIVVVGLGNTNITPDNLGPLTASNVFATRHITGEIAKSTGLEGLRAVAVLAPGVLGQTGIETAELLSGISKSLTPAAFIVVDALASRSLERLGCTVQISDSGISPGSGVGNSRPRINRNTMGVPVISMGVPTIVDAITLACDLTGGDREEMENKAQPRGEPMMVTPREIDLLIERAARVSAMAINRALQPELSIEDITMLVS